MRETQPNLTPLRAEGWPSLWARWVIACFLAVVFGWNELWTQLSERLPSVSRRLAEEMVLVGASGFFVVGCCLLLASPDGPLRRRFDRWTSTVHCVGCGLEGGPGKACSACGLFLPTSE